MNDFSHLDEQYLTYFKSLLNFMEGCAIIVFFLLVLVFILALLMLFYKIFKDFMQIYVLVREDGKDKFRVVYHKKN